VREGMCNTGWCFDRVCMCFRESIKITTRSMRMKEMVIVGCRLVSVYPWFCAHFMHVDAKSPMNDGLQPNK
jgi:hypothetical protein